MHTNKYSNLGQNHNMKSKQKTYCTLYGFSLVWDLLCLCSLYDVEKEAKHPSWLH